MICLASFRILPSRLSSNKGSVSEKRRMPEAQLPRRVIFSAVRE
jgi:hypothetical protein